MNRPRPLRDYPAATLDALQSAITALLLGYQDMLPTDLSVKLDIFRYDVSQATAQARRRYLSGRRDNPSLGRHP